MFKAELNRFLTNELAEDGYSGVQVRHTPARTEIIILATRTQNVLGRCWMRVLLFGGGVVWKVILYFWSRVCDVKTKALPVCGCFLLVK